MIMAETPEILSFWADFMIKALAAIDGLCLRRMEQSTYEALRRQQQALLAGVDVPKPRRVDV
jgi:hypothetical protein